MRVLHTPAPYPGDESVSDEGDIEVLIPVVVEEIHTVDLGGRRVCG